MVSNLIEMTLFFARLTPYTIQKWAIVKVRVSVQITFKMTFKRFCSFYFQGSAFICGLLLIQNIPEEEAFSIFVQVMQQYNLREMYKPNMYHLGLCMYQLDCLVQEYFPELHKHFLANSFHTSMYCSSWFLTLFTTALPLPLVCRIFEIFLNEVTNS